MSKKNSSFHESCLFLVDNKTKERIDFIKATLSEKNIFSEKVWDIKVIPYFNRYRLKDSKYAD